MNCVVTCDSLEALDNNRMTSNLLFLISEDNSKQAYCVCEVQAEEDTNANCTMLVTKCS